MNPVISAISCMKDLDGPTCNTVSVRGKGIIKLLFSIIVIAFLMLFAMPRLVPVLGLKPMAEFIEERNIDANMYFYTEVAEFSEANIHMDNTWAYTPTGPRNTNP
ncbi:MAG: hypothetical protein HKM93_13800 [Desulfobacteraceae bacterium]|nr:hypothetical protein [Desulfobacteraceae bacterium]